MISIKHTSPLLPLRIILGAGNQQWEGWLPSQKEDLDLLSPRDWELTFQSRLADAFLCEHVWEHLTEEEGRAAAKLCFKYLNQGAYIRCAVPDGYFLDPEYQNIIKIGGPGTKNHPAADHKIVYNYKLFSNIFTEAGFEVDLLEYCDENGRFHYNQWSIDDGIIYRLLLCDPRNWESKIKFVSIIIDARKKL